LLRLFFAAALCLGNGLSVARAEPVSPGQQQFLETYCLDCHDTGTHKAGLNLETLGFDLDRKKTASLWEAVFDKVADGQMPPKKAEQPEAAARGVFLETLGGELRKASLARQREQGRVPLRRLTRAEYENSVRDLLGVETELQELFPEDAATEGFQKVAEGLSLSAVHFSRYQDAAEKALADAIPGKPFTPLRFSRDGLKIMEGNAKEFKRWGAWVKDGAFVMPSNLFYPYTAVKLPQASRRGRYRLRVGAFGVNTGGRPIPVALNVRRSSSLPDAPEAFAWHDVPESTPKTMVSDQTLGPGEHFTVYGWTLPHRDSIDGRLKAFKDTPEQWPEIALGISSVEVEGPLTPDGAIDSWPPRSYRELFGAIPLLPLSQTRTGGPVVAGNKALPKRDDAAWAADPLVPYSEFPARDAEVILGRFIPKAFRRPVSANEQRPYLEGVLQALESGVPFHEAIKEGLMAVLCSPGFLLLEAPPGRLDDFALASRLSYFLWNSPPDNGLLGLAAQGKLSDPETLRKEVDRLLADPKSGRFERDFTGQWLDLAKINATAPDSRLYPEFDRPLQESALRETELFFHEVLERDLSVLEFVHSEWTFLNERLARHYGLPDLPGYDLRKVYLPEGSRRGGVMTQASVLKVTANGATTSPILRGKWICERLLGVSPPPPPEDVKKIEPDIRGATTIREQLEKHRSSAACASCHEIMDPPGFALEGFDVIGGLRTFYRTTSATAEKVQIPNTRLTVRRGLPVQEGYALRDGRPFAHVDEYKRLLLADGDALARNLVRKLLTYATGAPVQFADRERVEEIVGRLRPGRYGLRSMVHQVVQSSVFLSK
jgi:hypothetical protein